MEPVQLARAAEQQKQQQNKTEETRGNYNLERTPHFKEGRIVGRGASLGCFMKKQDFQINGADRKIC